jgi:hypothetical protein
LDPPVCSGSALCGIAKEHPGALIAELAGRWTAAQESLLAGRRGLGRMRAAGAGSSVGLRGPGAGDLGGVAVGAVAQGARGAFEVSPSTIDRAVGEIRPLPAARGLAATARPGIRLRTLADMFAYAEVEVITLRIGETVCMRAARRRSVRAESVRVGQEEAEHPEGHDNQ